jgi:hypothetical protein
MFKQKHTFKGMYYNMQIKKNKIDSSFPKK